MGTEQQDDPPGAGGTGRSKGLVVLALLVVVVVAVATRGGDSESTETADQQDPDAVTEPEAATTTTTTTVASTTTTAPVATTTTGVPEPTTTLSLEEMCRRANQKCGGHVPTTTIRPTTTTLAPTTTAGSPDVEADERLAYVDSSAVFVEAVSFVGTGGSDPWAACDGSALAFTSDAFGDGMSLYTIDVASSQVTHLLANTSGPAPLLSPRFEASPVWSPGCGAVSFAVGNVIYEVDVVSAEVSVLLEAASQGRVHHLAWSPEGTELAYLLTVDGPSAVGFENAAQVLPPHLEWSGAEAISWQDGGQPVVLFAPFVASLGPQPYELITVGGGSSIVPVDPLDITSLFGDGQCCQLSPDGERLAFQSLIDGYAGDTSADADIFVVDLASGAITQVTDDSSTASAPVWSADGTRLAFVRYDYTATEPDGGAFEILSSETSLSLVSVGSAEIVELLFFEDDEGGTVHELVWMPG